MEVLEPHLDWSIKRMECTDRGQIVSVGLCFHRTVRRILDSKCVGVSSFFIYEAGFGNVLF